VFARSFTMSVKPGRASDLVAVMESEILPRVRLEDGFQDALLLIAPGGREATELSLWSRRADAEQYARKASVLGMQRLAEFLDAVAAPRLFQVWVSTFHEIKTRSRSVG